MTVEAAAALRMRGLLGDAEALLRRLLDDDPSDLAALVELARTLRQRADHPGALALFETAAQANPDHLGLKIEAATELRALGRLDEAETFLRQALERNPAHFHALVTLGHLLRQKSDAPGSLAAFEAAAAAAPEHIGVRMEAAAALRTLGRADEAEALVRQVLEREPAHVHALATLGHLLRERSDPQGALSAFEAASAADPAHIGVKIEAASTLKALGRDDEAEAFLRQALGRDPRHFHGLVTLGHLLRQRSDQEGALAAFEAAAAVNPLHVGARLEVVNALRHMGRVEEAERQLEALLEREPEQSAALCALGSLKLDAFRPAEAEQLLRRAIAAAPLSAAPRLGLGAVLRRLGDRAGALAAFEAALSCEPASATAAANVIAELREQGRFEEARQAIETLRSRPQGAFHAHLQQGLLHRAESANEAALAAFEAAHANEPAQIGPVIEIVETLRALGRPVEAHERILQGLRLDKDNPGLQMQLAEHLLLAEDAEAALKISLEAISAHPRRMGPYLTASRAAAELGEQQQAMDYLDAAARQVGPHPEIVAAKAGLAMRWHQRQAAEALFAGQSPETAAHFSVWAQRVRLAIRIADYETAEALLPVAPPTRREASLAAQFRGEIAEGRWRLEEAVDLYRQAIAIQPDNAGAQANLARISLKLLDVEGAARSLRAVIGLTSSGKRLRGQSLNVSQTHLGQWIDEFALDPQLLRQLQEARQAPPAERIAALKTLVLDNPDYTPAALALLIALRQAGAFAAPPLAGPPIPRRILQFWDEPEPPADIVELMESWRLAHADFAYVRFDDRDAQAFLIGRGLLDVLIAYQRAREPAQKADIIRLAYLATEGGFYVDADDRCLSPIASFAPAEANFIAYQEDYGTLGNNFLGAAPGHPVFRLALRLATDSLNRGDADFLWLSTGPGLLTRAFCAIAAREEFSAAVLSRAVVLDMGIIERHIGVHCPVRYKKTTRHWSRSSFAWAPRGSLAARFETD
jgi:tetratricopeptide (TPR) repeat protein